MDLIVLLPREMEALVNLQIFTNVLLYNRLDNTKNGEPICTSMALSSEHFCVMRFLRLAIIPQFLFSVESILPNFNK